MKIIVSQVIRLKDKPYPSKIIYKTFESDFIARIGDSLSDTLWKDPDEYKVVDVNINYSYNECYISLEPYIVLDEKNIKDIFDLACEYHGWSDRA